MAWGGAGSGYACEPGALSLPVSGACVAQLLFAMRGSERDALGSDGMDGSAALSKLKPLVRSPVTDRRQALKLGTSAPKRRSRKRSIEVWSNVSLHTSPPRE